MGECNTTPWIVLHSPIDIRPGKSWFFYFNSAIIRVHIWPKSNDSVSNSGNSVAFLAHSAIFVPIWVYIRVIVRKFGPFWSHLARFWPLIGLSFDLIRDAQNRFESILGDSVLFGTYWGLFISDSRSSPNHRRMFRILPIRPCSGRIGPNLFGRIRFWCNPCFIGGLDFNILVRRLETRNFVLQV